MKAATTPPTPLPPRLAVYRALCQLSPEAYAVLARMILSTAQAEAEITGRPEKMDMDVHFPGSAS